MRLAIVAASLILSACVTTTKIVPAGQDTYLVSAANDACGNCEPPQIRLTEQANEYCAKLGKSMIVRNTENQTFDIGFGHRVTMTFSCM
jgi:hypothetical protein